MPTQSQNSQEQSAADAFAAVAEEELTKADKTRYKPVVDDPLQRALQLLKGKLGHVASVTANIVRDTSSCGAIWLHMVSRPAAEALALESGSPFFSSSERG